MTTIKAYKVKWNIEAQHWPNQFQMKKSLWHALRTVYNVYRAMTITLSPGEAHTLQMIEAWVREQTIVYLFYSKASMRCLMSFLPIHTI